MPNNVVSIDSRLTVAEERLCLINDVRTLLLNDEVEAAERQLTKLAAEYAFVVSVQKSERRYGKGWFRR